MRITHTYRDECHCLSCKEIKLFVVGHTLDDAKKKFSKSIEDKLNKILKRIK